MFTSTTCKNPDRLFGFDPSPGTSLGNRKLPQARVRLSVVSLKQVTAAKWKPNFEICESVFATGSIGQTPLSKYLDTPKVPWKIGHDPI